MTWLHKLRDSYRRMHPFAHLAFRAAGIIGGLVGDLVLRRKGDDQASPNDRKPKK